MWLEKIGEGTHRSKICVVNPVTRDGYTGTIGGNLFLLLVKAKIENNEKSMFYFIHRPHYFGFS